MRTLVVEDSSSMRALLTELLAEREYDVTAVESAEEALKAHHQQPFDLMLVDWTLPGISGLDLCRLVRSRAGGEDVVILVITGRNRPEDLNAVLDAGASDYLAKPIDPDILRTRLLVAERAVRDAKLRRETQSQRRRAEQAFRTLIESLPDSVLVYQTGTIVYANPESVRYLGFPDADAMLERPWLDSIHADDREAVLNWIDGVENSAHRTPIEVRLVTLTGTVVSGEITAMPLLYQGERSLLFVVRDMTERKEMQSRLLLADRMASVGTLAAGVAHELNNPLMYVLSNLRLTREELEQPIDAEWIERARQQVDEAIHGAGRMQSIIGDLKTFSRGDDEQSGNVNVSDVLESSINMCWNELRHRTTLERDFGTTPKVEVNESRLGQVFLNLLINAAQAMPERGVGANCITVSTLTDDQGWAVVRIGDNGLGIANEHMRRIFDPFFTTKEVSEGTGLGLSICRNIITSAGGSITAESRTGQGTTFEVRLPPSLADSVRPDSFHPPSVRSGPTARVVVVDDELLVGRSIRRALRNHDVQVFSSGKEAIEVLCNGGDPVDIIFCDIMMPEVSGMEVYSEVAERRPELASRFVFMTGGVFTTKARDFLRETTLSCLDKPFELRQIRDLVRERSASAS